MKLEELEDKIKKQDQLIEYLYENLIGCIARSEAIMEVFDCDVDAFNIVSSSSLKKKRADDISIEMINKLTDNIM